MYGKEPVVIYKLDRKPARAVFRASALIKAGGGTGKTKITSKWTWTNGGKLPVSYGQWQSRTYPQLVLNATAQAPKKNNIQRLRTRARTRRRRHHL